MAEIAIFWVFCKGYRKGNGQQWPIWWLYFKWPKTKRKEIKSWPYLYLMSLMWFYRCFSFFFRHFEIGHFCPFRFILFRHVLCRSVDKFCPKERYGSKQKNKPFMLGILILSSAHPSVENGLILFSKKHL